MPDLDVPVHPDVQAFVQAFTLHEFLHVAALHRPEQYIIHDAIQPLEHSELLQPPKHVLPHVLPHEAVHVLLAQALLQLLPHVEVQTAPQATLQELLHPVEQP